MPIMDIPSVYLVNVTGQDHMVTYADQVMDNVIANHSTKVDSAINVSLDRLDSLIVKDVIVIQLEPVQDLVEWTVHQEAM